MIPEVQSLIQELKRHIDSDMLCEILEIVSETYYDSDNTLYPTFEDSISWLLSPVSSCAGWHDPFTDQIDLNDRSEWESIRNYLADFPILRFQQRLRFGWLEEEAAEILGIRRWYELAGFLPAYPGTHYEEDKEGTVTIFGMFNPLGWMEPGGEPWVRPGTDIEYGKGPVRIDMTIEEARACYLWMIVILGVRLEAWHAMERLAEDLKEWVGLPVSELPNTWQEVGHLEMVREQIRWCEWVAAGLREGRWPDLRSLEPCFECFAGSLALAGVVPAAVVQGGGTVVLPCGPGRALEVTFAGQRYGDSKFVKLMPEEIQRVMEERLPEFRELIERLLADEQPSRPVIRFDRDWQVPTGYRSFVWQAVFGREKPPRVIEVLDEY